MKLRLKDIAVECILGEEPDERTTVQCVGVNVELTLSDARAAVSDDLADTVDYAALTAEIRSALVAARCHLIEHAARVVYEVCRRDGRVTAACVTVRKTGRVAGLGAAEVVYDGR